MSGHLMALRANEKAAWESYMAACDLRKAFFEIVEDAYREIGEQAERLGDVWRKINADLADAIEREG